MVIDVRNVRKVYGEGEASVTALEDVSLQIEAGETVGLLGPNGAGKTTLIKCILGLTTLSNGSVSIRGIDPHEDPTAAYEHVSAVLEGARNVYWRLSVYQNLRFFAGLHGHDPNELEDEFDRILEMLNLEDKRHETVRNLSTGMKQKLTLGCMLARRTPIVFLDEPTLGLDVEASHDLRAELNTLATEDDRTIVLSSHDMDVVRDVCDRIVILDEGSIIADDDIETLLSTFSTKTYRIVVEPPLRNRSQIDEYDVTVNQHARGLQLTYTTSDRDSIYGLMDTLERAGATIHSIETLEADLEETFMTIIDGDGAQAEPAIEGETIR